MPTIGYSIGNKKFLFVTRTAKIKAGMAEAYFIF
jgi:hypothetical protein